jgi:ribosomal protein S6--L-glutamate ligase
VVRLGEVQPDHHLYVLKSRTEMALGFAGALHAGGAAIINPYPVSAALRDKITTMRILMNAGIQVPETFVTAHPEQLTPILEGGPLVVKPYRGSGARGLHIVWDAEQLDSVPTNQGPILAQRFLEGKGRVRKLYVISGQIFGVEQRWPAHTYTDQVGEAFTVTPQLRDIARRCAKAFGIEVFGLDIVGRGARTYVVDVHSFPSFKGVPDASLRLADYIYHTCRSLTKGEKLFHGVGSEMAS